MSFQNYHKSGYNHAEVKIAYQKVYTCVDKK